MDPSEPDPGGPPPTRIEEAPPRVVYLMRGLPCCGKSFTARRLAGAAGVVCETDEYFLTHVGDDPTRYDYREDLLDEARRWNLERFRRAVEAGASPVVVDRGNSRSPESATYARLALRHGYLVELREPESEWWRQIRTLLARKREAAPLLDAWADRLAAMSRRTGHRVPSATIRRWIAGWKHDLTVEDILSCGPPASGEIHA